MSNNQVIASQHLILVKRGRGKRKTEKKKKKKKCNDEQGLPLTDGIGAAKRQSNSLKGKGGREQPPGARIGLLKVDDLGPGPVRKV